MEFQVGDKVVYPTQGVSVVERICEQELLGSEVRCYDLRLTATGSRLVVPVDNSDRVGLRRLSDPSEIERAMDRLHDFNASGEGDWKDRYQGNLERLKSGELEQVVDVLLCLTDISSKKALSFRERKMYDQARQLLVYEVAAVSAEDVEEVEGVVQTALDRRLEQAQ